MKIYISGKITGLDNAKEIFDAAEKKVTETYQDAQIVNPMKLPHDHDKTWESYMRDCLVEMMRCDTIYVLENWEDSKGAKLEVALAIQLNFNIFGSDLIRLLPKIDNEKIRLIIDNEKLSTVKG